MLQRIKKIIVITILLILSSIFLLAFIFYAFKRDLVLVETSEGNQVVLEELANGLSIPWGMTFLASELLLVTEREGFVKLINTKLGKSTEIILPANIFVKSECGLLDVAVRKHYTEKDWIYFTYSKLIDGNGYTALAKAKLVANSLVEWQDIKITKSAASQDGRHCGSRILFDSEGYIFFTTGDRGDRQNAQNLKTHTGSILRVDEVGNPAITNPFISNKEVLSEIFSFGHRNPQGIAYDKLTNRIWVSEHGPRGGDEINEITAGSNYGWPIVTYGTEYHGPSIGVGFEKEGMTGPVKVIPPEFSPSSLMFYDGEVFDFWRGNLFVGGLASQKVLRLVMDSSGRVLYEEILFEEIHERIRNIKQGPDGLIYFSTDNGRILKVRPISNDDFIDISIFKHIDFPGFLISFDFKFFYSY